MHRASLLSGGALIYDWTEQTASDWACRANKHIQAVVIFMQEMFSPIVDLESCESLFEAFDLDGVGKLPAGFHEDLFKKLCLLRGRFEAP